MEFCEEREIHKEKEDIGSMHSSQIIVLQMKWQVHILGGNVIRSTFQYKFLD